MHLSWKFRESCDQFPLSFGFHCGTGFILFTAARRAGLSNTQSDMHNNHESIAADGLFTLTLSVGDRVQREARTQGTNYEQRVRSSKGVCKLGR
jgi:hypothetical protein